MTRAALSGLEQVGTQSFVFFPLGSRHCPLFGVLVAELRSQGLCNDALNRLVKELSVCCKGPTASMAPSGREKGAPVGSICPERIGKL